MSLTTGQLISDTQRGYREHRAQVLLSHPNDQPTESVFTSERKGTAVCSVYCKTGHCHSLSSETEEVCVALVFHKCERLPQLCGDNLIK